MQQLLTPFSVRYILNIFTVDSVSLEIVNSGVATMVTQTRQCYVIRTMCALLSIIVIPWRTFTERERERERVPTTIQRDVPNFKAPDFVKHFNHSLCTLRHKICLVKFPILDGVQFKFTKLTWNSNTLRITSLPPQSRVWTLHKQKLYTLLLQGSFL